MGKSTLRTPLRRVRRTHLLHLDTVVGTVTDSCKSGGEVIVSVEVDEISIKTGQSTTGPTIVRQRGSLPVTGRQNLRSRDGLSIGDAMQQR